MNISILLQNFCFRFICLFIVLPLSNQTGFAQNTEAVDSLQNALETNLSDEKQIDVYLALAKAYVSSDSTLMMSYIDIARELADVVDDKKARIDAVDIIGMSLSLRGKNMDAETQYKIALENSKKIEYLAGEGRAYGRIGTTYLFRGYLDTAAFLFSKSIEIHKQIGNREGLAYTYHGMGNHSLFKGNYKKALAHYHQSLELKNEIGDYEGKLSTYMAIGNTFARQGIHLPAIDNYFKTLVGFEKVGNKNYLSIAINNIGNIYFAQKDYPKALEYYKKSLKVRKDLDDTGGIAACYSNIGAVYSHLNDYDQTIDYYKKSLLLREKLGNRRGMAISWHNLGETYAELEQYSAALKNHNWSLQIRRDMGDKRGITHSLLNIGKIHLNMGNKIKAAKYIQEGCALAQEIESIEEMKLGYRVLSVLESQRENYKVAFESHMRYKHLSDSLLNQENTKKITRLEAEFEFQQEKDSIAFEQEKINLAFTEELDRKQILIKASAGAIISVIIILILLYHSYLIKQKKNLELSYKNEVIELKNGELVTKNLEVSALRETEQKMAKESLAFKERELTNITLLSHEKNELLQQIGEQIGSLSGKVDDQIIPDLKEIKQTIKSNISNETWNAFTYHFEQVHPEFFNKLKGEYEDLNQNDLRLCAYIKVGLNNKVIAQMGNVTLAGVKKNINRLKKKMDIGPEESLRDFMMGFV